MNAKIEHNLFVCCVRLYDLAWESEPARCADKVVGVSFEIALAPRAAEQTLDFFVKFYVHLCLLSAEL